MPTHTTEEETPHLYGQDNAQQQAHLLGPFDPELSLSLWLSFFFNGKMSYCAKVVGQWE